MRTAHPSIPPAAAPFDRTRSGSRAWLIVSALWVLFAGAAQWRHFHQDPLAGSIRFYSADERGNVEEQMQAPARGVSHEVYLSNREQVASDDTVSEAQLQRIADRRRKDEQAERARAVQAALAMVIAPPIALLLLGKAVALGRRRRFIA